MTSHDGDLPDADTLTAAVYTNGFRALQPAIGSTGYRTHPFRQDALRLASDEGRVAETFLVNSRLRRRDAEFEASVGLFLSEAGSSLASAADRRTDAADAVTLPPARALPMSLGAAFAQRRSVRSYTGEPAPLADVACLAAAAAGVTSASRHQPGPFRAVPSAGALYPVEVVLVALRVTGLPTGVYAYDPRPHRLNPRGGDAMVAAVLGAMAVSAELLMWDRACLLLLLVGRPWRSMRKYGARGMRHVFLEAGAMAEHVHLAATALGLGSVDCSSVYDDEAHEALGMDGLYEALLHVVVVGSEG
jgi:SagB-type dehydrogenase family enzyme